MMSECKEEIEELEEIIKDLRSELEEASQTIYEQEDEASDIRSMAYNEGFEDAEREGDKKIESSFISGYNANTLGSDALRAWLNYKVEQKLS